MFVISELDAAVMLMGEDGWLHSSAAAASPSPDAEHGRLGGGNRDFAASLIYSVILPITPCPQLDLCDCVKVE